MTKILLVEDDKSLREIYGVRLLAEGYDIVSAGDGEEALAMAIKERPNLIISDVMMPKISGFDMLDILRSTTETRGIKVIMMTALSSEDQRKRGESLGADRYLVKSQVGIEDVVKSVHEVLADGHLTPEQRIADKSAPKGEPTSETTEQPAQSAADQAPRRYQQAPTPTQATSHQPQPPAQDANLPRPVAPFSTDRPGTGTSLSERVIQPPAATIQSEVSEQAFAQQMENILSGQAPQEFGAQQVPEQPQAQPVQSAQSVPVNQPPVSPPTPAPQPIQQAPIPAPVQQPQPQMQQPQMQPQQPVQPQPVQPQMQRPAAPQQPIPQAPARPNLQPISQPSRPETPTFGAR